MKTVVFAPDGAQPETAATVAVPVALLRDPRLDADTIRVYLLLLWAYGTGDFVQIDQEALKTDLGTAGRHLDVYLDRLINWRLLERRQRRPFGPVEYRVLGG